MTLRRLIWSGTALLIAIAPVGCGGAEPPHGGTPAVPPEAREMTPEVAAAAVVSAATLPEDRAAANRTLRRLGREAVPAACDALPEPLESGWPDGALSLANFIAEFAPPDAAELPEVRRKAALALKNFKAWLDRQLRLRAMAEMDLDPRDSLAFGFREKRHEELAERLKPPAPSTGPPP